MRLSGGDTHATGAGLADVVILDGHAADGLAAGGIVRADTKGVDGRCRR